MYVVLVGFPVYIVTKKYICRYVNVLLGYACLVPICVLGNMALTYSGYIPTSFFNKSEKTTYCTKTCSDNNQSILRMFKVVNSILMSHKCKKSDIIYFVLL